MAWFRQLQFLRRKKACQDKSIAAAGNTVVSALLALEGLGFEVTTESSSVGEMTIAVRGEEKYVAEDPVTVLGLIKLIELRTWRWVASDSEIAKTLQKYRLDDLTGSQ